MNQLATMFELLKFLRSHTEIVTSEIHKNKVQRCQMAEFTAKFRKAGGIELPLGGEKFGGTAKR